MKKQLKRAVCLFLAGVLIVAAFAGCSGGGTGTASSGGSQPSAPAPSSGNDPYADLDSINWKISNSQAPDHFYQLALEEMAAYVEERSGGKFTMDVYHSGTLGTEQEVVENMQAGTIAGTLGAASLMANFVPAFNLFALPALFEDSRQLEDVLNDDDIMQRINEACEAAGIYNYGYFQTFFRTLYSKDEIKTVSDFQGQKIRVMGSDIIVNTFQALGCNPTTTAWTELYSALQLGVCDGLDHIASSVESMAFYENLGYVCDPKLFATPMFIVFSKPMYDALPQAYQELLDEAIERVLVPRLQEDANRSNDESLEFLLTEGGLQFVECDVDGIQEAAIPVRDRYIEELDEWVREIALEIIARG